MSDNWKITNKRAIGLYMSGPVQGPGWANEGYYHTLYEITEIDETLHKVRTRVIHGESHRDYGEGYEAACVLYKTYLNKSLKLDKKEKSQ